MAKKKLAPRKARAQKASLPKKAPLQKASQKKAPKKLAKKKLAPKRVAPKTIVRKIAVQKKQKAVLKNSKVSRPSPKAVKGGVSIPKAESALLSIGDLIPQFSAMNELGEIIHSQDWLGKKLILYFYPKDDTPGCTQESCDFRDHFARLERLGAQVFGVSRDSIQSHAKFKGKHEFPFSLLSDEDGKICESYGVWKEKNLYGRKYMGIERSTFLIDESGRVQKIYSKVKVAGHVDQVLEDLQ